MRTPEKLKKILAAKAKAKREAEQEKNQQIIDHVKVLMAKGLSNAEVFEAVFGKRRQLARKG